MGPAIRIEGLTKVFSSEWGRSSRTALQSVSLEIMPGQLVGIFGGNGSGKSTLLKILCGLQTPTSGKLEVLGQNPRAASHSGRLGYSPEHPGFPGYLTPRNLLRMYARLGKISGQQLQELVTSCLEMEWLVELADQPIRTLSKGNLQRLALAQALVHDPDILLLDEPADGLDPMARKNVHGQLKTLSQSGKTLLISTHLLAGLESLCDQVLILHQGKSLFCGPPEFEDGLESWWISALQKEGGVHV